MGFKPDVKKIIFLSHEYMRMEEKSWKNDELEMEK